MNELDKREIGERIKSIRKSRGESQTEFAKVIDATLPAVSNWETGRNIPNNKRIKRIAELGNITVNELLYGDLKQHVYKILHDELLESGELYKNISKYLTLLDSDLNDIPNTNDKIDILQIKSESFLRENINLIIEFIKDGYIVSDTNKLYEDSSLIIDIANLYMNHLIYNEENKIIFNEHFNLSFLKDIHLKDIEDVEDVEDIGNIEKETRYTFDCRISLETTDELGNSEYVELNYISNININIFIFEVDNIYQFSLTGLYALDELPYRAIFEEETLEIVKDYIISEVLKHESIKDYNLTFDDLEELS